MSDSPQPTLERVENILNRATLITVSEGHGPGSRVTMAGWRLEDRDMRELVSELAALRLEESKRKLLSSMGRAA